jgi:hypothetical protein
MSGRHVIPARLDNEDLYVGIWCGCGLSLLGEDCDGRRGVDEGGVI